MHFRVTVWTSQGQQVLGPGDSDGNWCRPQPSLRKTWESWDSFVFRSTLNMSNRNNLTIISQPQASLKVLFKSIWLLLRLDLHDELCRVFFCLVELLGKRKQAAFKTELSWLQAVLKKKIDTDKIEIIILYQSQINFTSGFPLELSLPSIFQQNISQIVPMTQNKHFSQDEFLCCRSSFIPRQTPGKTWARLVR